MVIKIIHHSKKYQTEIVIKPKLLLMSYFKNTDLDMNYSHWQSNSKIKFFLLPPLAFDTKLQGVQSKSNSQQTRIDFILKKNKNEIIWQDLINGKTFKFELVKDSIDKLSLIHI